MLDAGLVGSEVHGSEVKRLKCFLTQDVERSRPSKSRRAGRRRRTRNHFFLYACITSFLFITPSFTLPLFIGEGNPLPHKWGMSRFPGTVGV